MTETEKAIKGATEPAGLINLGIATILPAALFRITHRQETHAT